jgi:hypothetical protein
MGRTSLRYCLISIALLASVLVTGCGGSDDSDSDGGGGANTLELIGRIDQTGASFAGYGYVTHVDGIEDSALFSSPPLTASEKSARLTFSFKAELGSRATLGNEFALRSKGTIQFFSNDQPAADFEKPDSFAQGDQVASGPIDIQTVITVYAPDKGILDASGTLSLDDTGDFKLGDTSASLPGGSERLSLSGSGTRSDAILPKSVIDFAGSTTGD